MPLPLMPLVPGVPCSLEEKLGSSMTCTVVCHLPLPSPLSQLISSLPSLCPSQPCPALCIDCKHIRSASAAGCLCVLFRSPGTCLSSSPSGRCSDVTKLSLTILLKLSLPIPMWEHRFIFLLCAYRADPRFYIIVLPLRPPFPIRR